MVTKLLTFQPFLWLAGGRVSQEWANSIPLSEIRTPTPTRFLLEVVLGIQV